MECQLNRTLKGCKRRASPVYLLIRSAIFRICWHPYQGAQGFGFGFRWYRYAQPPAKDWHPFGMRQQHKKSKGSGHFCTPKSHLLPALKEFVGKSEDRSPWAFTFPPTLTPFINAFKPSHGAYPFIAIHKRVILYDVEKISSSHLE